MITHAGWEYCVLKRALTAAPTLDGDMLVTAIEFEGRPEEAILGTLGFRVSLIAYPCVAVRRVRGQLWGTAAAAAAAGARRAWGAVV